MREAIIQVFQNLRANKLRSFLTMFGILWGVISVVILSATGEGFRRGNQHVLEELGRNIAIVWGGRTSMQVGGERAGRRILLTIDDVRALQRESSMIRVVSPEINRRASVKSVYNAATLQIHDLCVERGVPMWCGGMLETGIGRAHNIHIATLPGFTYPGDTASASRTYARDIVAQPLEATGGMPEVKNIGLR